MADNDLRFRLDIDADVSGQQDVDGLRRSVDNLGETSEQAFNNLADGQRKAKASTDQLAAAFRTLGLRSASEIEADLLEVNQALQRLARQSQLTGAEFDRAFAAGQARLQRLRAELAGTDQSLGLVGQRSEALIGIMGRLGAAFAGLELAREFLATNVELERMERGFQAIAGGSEQAAAEMAYVRDVADRLALPVITAGKAYLQLMAATKGTAVEGQQTRVVFEAVTRAMSLAGKSAADTSTALLALSQIASKGHVSMEELRGQLGESLPGALNAAAAGFGITTAELIKLTESGQLTAEQLFPALARGLDTLYKSSTSTAQSVDTLAQKWDRFKNSLADAFKTIGDAGVVKVLKVTLEGLEGVLIGFSTGLSAVVQKINIFYEALRRGPIFLTGFSEETKKAFADVDRVVAEKLAAAGRHNRLFAGELKNTQAAAGDAARGIAQVGDAATQAGRAAGSATDGIVQLNVLYSELAKDGEAATKQAEKTAAARKAEGDAAMALAAALGTESEQQQANTAAKQATADALRRLAVERQADLTQAERHLASLQAEIATRGKASEQEQQQLDNLGKLIEARRSEADAAIAGAQAAAVAAAAAQTAALAEADNSARVNELAAAYGAAAAQRAALEAQKLAGVDVAVQLAEAQIVEGQAAALYRDALNDQTDAIERNASVKQSQLSVEQALIRLAVEQQRTALEVARARGDETAATRALLEMKRLEIKLAELLASAKKAEADAALAAVQAKRAELQAAGQLTAAKEAELQALEAGARVKQVEAEIAAEAAKRIRELADAARAAGDAAGDMGDGFKKSTQAVDELGNAAERTTERVRGLREEAARPTRLEGSISGSVGRRGEFAGDIDLRDTSGEKTVEQLKAEGLSQSEIQSYYDDRQTTETEKAHGIVNRFTRTELVNFEDVARNRGLTGEAVQEFIKLFGDLLNEEMAAARRANRGPVSARSAQAIYYGAFERAEMRAEEQARENLRLRDRQAGRATSTTSTTPATTHRVEITIGGKTVPVDTASPNAAKALIEVLTNLNNRTTA